MIAKKTEARASRWCYISYNTVVFHICRSERGSRDGLSALQKMNGSSGAYTSVPKRTKKHAILTRSVAKRCTALQELEILEKNMKNHRGGTLPLFSIIFALN